MLNTLDGGISPIISRSGSSQRVIFDGYKIRFIAQHNSKTNL